MTGKTHSESSDFFVENLIWMVNSCHLPQYQGTLD